MINLSFLTKNIEKVSEMNKLRCSKTTLQNSRKFYESRTKTRCKKKVRNKTFYILQYVVQMLIVNTTIEFILTTT